MINNNKNQLVRMITAQVIEKINASGLPGDKSALVLKKLVNHNKPILEKETNIGLLEGIITARKLEGYTSIKIPKNSIITPAAKDVIKEKKILVNFVDSLINPNRAKGCTKSNWLYWSSCSLLKCLEIQSSPDISIATSSINNSEDLVVSAIKNLNQAISSGKVKGGILTVKTSAKAAYLASRYDNMRVVVGSFPKTIEEGVQQLSANVLILEYAYLGKIAMAEMIKLFTNFSHPPVSDVLSHLEA